MNQCLVQYGDFGVRVKSADPTLLVWLREFLAPSFDFACGGQAAWDVTVEHDPVRCASLLSKGSSHEGETVECFTRDGHFLSFPLWEQRGQSRTVRDANCKLFYHVSLARKCVEILCEEANHLMRRAAARVIRELATGHCVRNGDIPIHGAAFARGGIAVLLAGPRRSGKTTQLTAELTHNRAQFIANDRVMLQRSAGGTIARGMPTVITLRGGTVELFPELARLQSDRQYHREFTLDEAQPAAIPTDGSMKLSQAQYGDLVGCTAVASGPLKEILFPVVVDNARRTTTQDVNGDEAARLLYDSLLQSDLPARHASLFSEADSDLIDNNRRRLRCHEIVQSIPCYRITVAPQTVNQWPDSPLWRRAAA